MDDLAHLNHRKRKAPQDDQQDSEPKDTRQSCDTILCADLPTRPAKAPRLSWLSPESAVLWNAPASPHVSSPLTSPSVIAAFPHKCSRTTRFSGDEVSSPLLTSQSEPPSPSKLMLSDSVSERLDGETDDMLVDSPPQSEQVLVDSPGLPTSPMDVDVLPSTTGDLTSLQIPPMIPFINRQSLKDLDFNEIMHNTLLRHDVLFESGLHFRPAINRRKKEEVEHYWDAVFRELESGCTCFSYDASNRKPIPPICVCSTVPLPDAKPFVFCPSPTVITIRTPSRVRGLLHEFLEVLLHVIQPLSMLSGPYVNSGLLHVPKQQHKAQAEHIRSLFDPEFIEQELRHRVFDPSGLFQLIGSTLKTHCAPMRDNDVDRMMHAAQACASDLSVTPTDAVNVLRSCLELLELMKLDIANHQVHTLRPILIHTSGPFERKMLSRRRSINPTLPVTREWLQKAHHAFLTDPKPITHYCQPQGLRYISLGQKQQLYISAVRSIVDLIFNPPRTQIPHSTSDPFPALSPPYFHAFPETLYLDQGRIHFYASQIVDALALWMFLLLFRQLLSTGTGQAKYPKEAVEELLKKEIRAIGPSKLGSCFLEANATTSHAQQRSSSKSRDAVNNIVLQIARRATDVLHNRKASDSSMLMTISNVVPSGQTLAVAEKWVDANLRPDSLITRLLHTRLKDAVFEKVLADVYPPRTDAALEKMAWQEVEEKLTTSPGRVLIPPKRSLLLGNQSTVTDEKTVGNGLESLTTEVQVLVDRISHLVVVHLNAYLPVYEKEDFMGGLF